MNIIDVAAGLLFGALAGMGIGGGGLIVIYLTALRGFSQIDAQGTNLLFFAVAAAASMFIHLKKRKIKVIPVLIMSLTGLVGAYFGARVTAVIPQELTRKLFGLMLIGSGIITLYRIYTQKGSNPYSKRNKTF